MVRSHWAVVTGRVHSNLRMVCRFGKKSGSHCFRESATEEGGSFPSATTRRHFCTQWWYSAWMQSGSGRSVSQSWLSEFKPSGSAAEGPSWAWANVLGTRDSPSIARSEFWNRLNRSASLADRDSLILLLHTPEIWFDLSSLALFRVSSSACAKLCHML